MAETIQPPPPPERHPAADAGATGHQNALVTGLIALAAVVIGSALLGLIAGFAWQQLAPRVVFVVVSRGTADVLNPETKAFIAADGWFCVVTAIGGAVSGLLGHLLAVRRHGPLPMIGLLVGGLAAALVAQWVGQQSGRTRFDAMLAVARPGATLRAPLTLGAHGALAFWPLAAGLVVGAIESGMLVRERKRRAAAATALLAAPSGYPAQPGGPGFSAAEPGAASGIDGSARPARFHWPAPSSSAQSSRPGHSSSSPPV
jgi:hypothetical protein